jgi:RsiW-degrading membrane proteinase PrsW (M82 family)
LRAFLSVGAEASTQTLLQKARSFMLRILRRVTGHAASASEMGRFIGANKGRKEHHLYGLLGFRA